eukprot:scpid68321/ scgid2003/ 
MAASMAPSVPVPSFESVLVAVRRDCASWLRSYERIVTASSSQSTLIGAAAYSLVFALAMSIFPRTVFVTVVALPVFVSGYLLYPCTWSNGTQAPAVGDGSAPSQSESTAVESPSASGARDADQATAESDPCLLQPLAKLCYWRYNVINSLEGLTGNAYVAGVACVFILPCVLLIILPMRLLVYLTGLYLLIYPSWRHNAMWRYLEPYLIQFLQMHAGNQAARKPAADNQKTEVQAEDPIPAEAADDDFQEALRNELDMDKMDADESAIEGDGDDDDDTGDLVQDSLLGLDMESYVPVQPSIPHSQHHMLGSSDPWDFNSTADLDDEFAEGLSFTSLQRTTPDSVVTDGRRRPESTPAPVSSLASSQGSTVAPLQTSQLASTAEASVATSALTSSTVMVEHEHVNAEVPLHGSDVHTLTEHSYAISTLGEHSYAVSTSSDIHSLGEHSYAVSTGGEHGRSVPVAKPEVVDHRAQAQEVDSAQLTQDIADATSTESHPHTAS